MTQKAQTMTEGLTKAIGSHKLAAAADMAMQDAVWCAKGANAININFERLPKAPLNLNWPKQQFK